VPACLLDLSRLRSHTARPVSGNYAPQLRSARRRTVASDVSAVLRAVGRCEKCFEISECLPLIQLSRVAIPPASPVGAVAQLGERLNGIQEVRGSIPLGSTNEINWLDGELQKFCGKCPRRVRIAPGRHQENSSAC
jgi:hypothetical protein